MENCTFITKNISNFTNSAKGKTVVLINTNYTVQFDFWTKLQSSSQRKKMVRSNLDCASQWETDQQVEAISLQETYKVPRLEYNSINQQKSN
jgi:hypothetical protein